MDRNEERTEASPFPSTPSRNKADRPTGRIRHCVFRYIFWRTKLVEGGPKLCPMVSCRISVCKIFCIHVRNKRLFYVRLCSIWFVRTGKNGWLGCMFTSAGSEYTTPDSDYNLQFTSRDFFANKSYFLPLPLELGHRTSTVPTWRNLISTFHVFFSFAGRMPGRKCRSEACLTKHGLKPALLNNRNLLRTSLESLMNAG